jgi:lipoprotein-anchoring transpeptidase ErfK/SrfK
LQVPLLYQDRNESVRAAFVRLQNRAKDFPMFDRTILNALIGVAIITLTGAPAADGAPKKKAIAAHNLSMESVNNAEWRGNPTAAVLLRMQALLDRAHASPGAIDATQGENTRKAIGAYRQMRGLAGSQRADEILWKALIENDKEPALVTYTITEKDVAGPFIEAVPEDYREKASLKRLSYTSAQELLAEKFHMSEQLLKRLNPDASFDKPGTEIVVANVQREELPRKIARVEVDASQQRVFAYDKGNNIVAVYPATVGSAERPSPTGEYKVMAVAENPTYHYDPSLNLTGVEVHEKLELPPGPNNPVGVVWIALSAKGYGIHGTPDPDVVSKRASHGCIRLTNWDALELAKHVSKGTPVSIMGAPKAGETKQLKQKRASR